MQETNNSNIIINETIDGKPIDAVSDTKPKNTVSKTKNYSDPYIWGIYIMLLIISVIELFSASKTEVTSEMVYGPLIRHGMFLLIGLGIAIMCQNIHYKYFRKWAWAFAIISLILLILSMVIGVNYNNAQRAIRLAGVTIQPAEIVKLAVVIWLAAIMAKHQMAKGVTTRGCIYSATIVLLFGGLLWKNGLTNTILLMGVSMAMFLIGGIQWKKLGVILIVYLMFGGVVYLIKYADKDDNAPETYVEQIEKKTEVDRTGTQMSRIKRFIEGVKPGDPITDENRQVVFSNYAQAHGGIYGNGPGNSRESARLPLAFSDYIYAIIIEDTGFIGGCILLILYLSLVARAGRVASKCSRAFPALLIMGCAVMIVFQALVHMAIVTGVFPVSGQPLPLISKGGTSVLVMSMAIGLMLSVSKFAVQNGTKKDIAKEKKELPDDMQSANPTQITYN